MGFFPKVLKHKAPGLLRTFNLSPKNSQVPDDRRRAIVAHTAKAPRTTDPYLFRPTSFTPVVCKVLETILKEKILAHLSQW